MSLELARNGHHVNGVDLSAKCIEIAKKTVANNIYRDGFGSLEYFNDNFLEMDLELGSYDSVMFYGALSHFPDVNKTLHRVSELLVPKGLILVWDTSVELYTKEDAGFLHFTRMLLSYCGNYYETKKLPKDANELDTQITQVLNELQYVDDDGENLQSPNDNSQTFASMMDAIEQHFDEKAFCWESCFYRNMIAGLRFDRPEKEHMLAKFIKQMESFFISQRRLNPAFFYYVGEKKTVL
jgi:ubiquinone/menaquinone biosynthesis C-methylase UbiE